MPEQNQTQIPKPAISAVDVGYGQVKAVISKSAGASDLEMKQICFPRVIATKPGRKWSSLRTASVYEMDDEAYMLGNDARSHRQHILSDQAKDYVAKPTYWLCIGKALHDMGAFNGAGFSNGNSLHLKKVVLGIAPGHHTDDVEAMMQKKLKDGYSFRVNGTEYSIQATDVYLLPQGAGPYFGYLLDDHGKTKKSPNGIKLSEQLYGIIDIGHETTDYLVFEGRQYIDPKESPSEANGVRYILEKILDYVKEKYGYNDEKSDLLRGVLCGETFLWKGEEVDLSSAVEKIIRDHLSQNLLPNILQRWQSLLGQMYKIFICGGGAAMIEKYMPDFLSDYKNQIIICEHPEIANVLGFHRFAMLKDFIETRDALTSA